MYLNWWGWWRIHNPIRHPNILLKHCDWQLVTQFISVGKKKQITCDTPLAISLSHTFFLSKQKGLELPENNFLFIPISERDRKTHSVHKHKKHQNTKLGVSAQCPEPKGSGHLLFFTLTLSFISFSFNPLISLLLLLVLLHSGALGSFHVFVVLIQFFVQ